MSHQFSIYSSQLETAFSALDDFGKYAFYFIFLKSSYHRLSSRGGRGFLAYLSDRDVTFFRVSKEGNFSGAGCQNMSKGKFFLDCINIWSNFCVLEYNFHRFFLESGIT